VADHRWAQVPVIRWSQLLLDSFCHWTGKELMARDGTDLKQAQRLFMLNNVVVSHGVEADPILNYGNQAALDLWEMTWEQLTRTPSRHTAEPVNQEERANLLRRVEAQGYFDRYRGVRISSTGKRFLVENALVWNVLNEQGQRIGQAATFSRWTPLP
jgi:MEKHLA domain